MVGARGRARYRGRDHLHGMTRIRDEVQGDTALDLVRSASWLPATVYLTVSVPTMPASLWPGTVQ
jgi:hypothetical protein